MQHKRHYKAHTHLHSRLPADRIIARFIEQLGKTGTAPLLIAVGGPGGSGKTTFSDKLRNYLSGCGVVHLDNYKTPRSERREKKLAGPHPDANRMQLVVDHLSQIKSGQSVTIPIYDAETGDIGSYTPYLPCQFNIIDGEISTYQELRPFIDLSIFIDSDFRTQLSARIGRDMEKRGHSLKKAINTFLTSNLTEFTQYGAESKQWADIHLFCHEDYHFSLEAVCNDRISEFRPLLQDTSQVQPAGCIVPVATPFEKNLSLCQTAYMDHLSYLNSKGVTRLIVGGTTAEFFSLTIAERITLLKLSREYFPGYIIFNISHNSITTAVELAKRAFRYGADAVICLPPTYYAQAPETGVIDYFRIITENNELPFYIYNFPKHAGNAVTPEILKAVPHVGIKDSSGDLSLISSTPCYLLGGESKVIEAYKQGGCGFIPGLPNAFPELYLTLENHLNQKDYPAAEILLKKLSSFKKALPPVSGIVVVKKFLNRLLESYPLYVRPPLDATPGETIDISALNRILISDL